MWETIQLITVKCFSSLPLKIKHGSIYEVSVPSEGYSPWWALDCPVAPPPAIVADNHGTYTIPAHVAHLIACTANHIPITAITTPASSVWKTISPCALPCHMPRNVAQVADRLILTVTCHVASFPAVLTCFIICAVSSKMPWLVAIVAQPHISRWRLRIWAIFGTMSRPATCVADALIRTVACYMPRFPTVPALQLCGALRSNMPEKKIKDAELKCLSNV